MHVVIPCACLQAVSRRAVAAVPAAVCVRQAAYAERQRRLADATPVLELHFPSW
jgi:hypothetical protein